MADVIDTHVALVAPIESGAGTNGKIVEALARGCPVVTSTFAALPLDLVHLHDAWVATNTAEFVEGCVRLVGDHDLRARFESAGPRIAARFGPAEVTAELGMLLGGLGVDFPIHPTLRSTPVD
jgi:glycosyltransferase involved in cell wall biosynthesis